MNKKSTRKNVEEDEKTKANITDLIKLGEGVKVKPSKRCRIPLKEIEYLR
ncbi:MAG: hypothetical protein MJ252_18515 [archaeon]|nr:hypothetical protein [archaeon]